MSDSQAGSPSQTAKSMGGLVPAITSGSEFPQAARVAASIASEKLIIVLRTAGSLLGTKL